MRPTVSRKNIIITIAAALGLAGTIAATFPGAGPAVGGVLVGGGQVLKQVGASLLDDCPGDICAGGAIHGTVGFVDGGQTCRCP